jgi:hypothetical protein
MSPGCEEVTENKIRSWIVKSLSSLGAFPVENTTFDGTPDIAVIGGWIEVKRHPFHVRLSQRFWHRRWLHLGGRSVFITVWGDTWMMHDSSVICAAESYNLEFMTRTARRLWTGKPGVEELLSAITEAMRINQ